MSEVFIIEHPRRGTLKGIDHGVVPGDGDKARFSLTGARDDPAKTAISYSLLGAIRLYKQIPTPLRYECDILVRNPDEPGYFKLVRV